MYGVLDGEKATGVSFLAEKAEDSAFLAEKDKCLSFLAECLPRRRTRPVRTSAVITVSK